MAKASVFKLDPHDGNEYRCAGHFLDGYFFRVVEVVRKPDGPYLTVWGGSDFKTNLYEVRIDIDEANPYSVRSIVCQRSAQSGNLMATLGGLHANEGQHRSMVIATDYAIREPLTFERFKAGER